MWIGHYDKPQGAINWISLLTCLHSILLHKYQLAPYQPMMHIRIVRLAVSCIQQCLWGTGSVLAERVVGGGGGALGWT